MKEYSSENHAKLVHNIALAEPSRSPKRSNGEFCVRGNRIWVSEVKRCESCALTQ
jgi:hypothetical protein